MIQPVPDQDAVGTPLVRWQYWDLWSSQGLGFDQWSLPGMDENCSSSYISKSMGKSGVNPVKARPENVVGSGKTSSRHLNI